MILNINEAGIHLGKSSRRITLDNKKNHSKEEFPITKIESINLYSKGISISNDAIALCAEYNVPINCILEKGKLNFKLISGDNVGRADTRRKQYEALVTEKGVEFAKNIIIAKIKNQTELIKYFSKLKKADRTKEIELLNGYIEKLKNIKGCTIEEKRDIINGYEGRASKVYWGVFAENIKNKYDFKGREYRGTDCPVNAMLNYGYGVLGFVIEASLEKAGLDIYGGLLHSDRSGKKSLVYDMIENFRQIVVDRSISSIINKGYNIKFENKVFDRDFKKIIVEKIEERLESYELFRGEKHKLKEIIELQAKNSASFFRGEKEIEPFIWRSK